MQLKAKFIGGLKLNPNEIVSLTTVISMTNQNQTGIAFEAFVELINRHSSRVEKLDIILSCYLHRHYVDLKTALKLGDNWIVENRSSLEKIKIPYEISAWRALLEKPAFSLVEKKVKEIYNENIEFQNIVNAVAVQHAGKADFESAKAYVLEECATTLLIEGRECYPGMGLGKAVHYILKLFESTKIFCGYRLSQVKPSNNFNSSLNEGEQLFSSFLSMSKLLEKNGINNVNAQAEFFKHFLQLKDQYIDS